METISLGYPLDQLLNREIKLPNINMQSLPCIGGISLPDLAQPGIGNIVIRGKPGVGKSTLALQIAAACHGNNNIYSAFISFEQPIEHVLKKAAFFGWDIHLHPVNHLQQIKIPPSPSQLSDVLHDIITQPPSCPFTIEDHLNWWEPRLQDIINFIEEEVTQASGISESGRVSNIENDFNSILNNLQNDIKSSYDKRLGDIDLNNLSKLNLNYLIDYVSQIDKLINQITTSTDPKILILNEKLKYVVTIIRIVCGVCQSFRPRVILPRLSPRSVNPDEVAKDYLFWERYHQLEALLIAAKDLRKTKYKTNTWYSNNTEHLLEENFDLRIVCVDSLNVFGDQPLTREELYRLFDLFRRHHIIGVFILEDDEDNENDPKEVISRDTAEYMADTVINLENGYDQGYFLRYFEITKSRYQHQVYGKHPFKIKHAPFDFKILENLPSERITAGLRVYPSLHYITSATDLFNKK